MDNIELPPLDNFTQVRAWDANAVRDYAAQAVLADRQKREKPPERKVQKQALAPFGTRLEVVVLCSDANRVWIDSGRNRELAKRLRNWIDIGTTVEEAANALDGGVQ